MNEIERWTVQRSRHLYGIENWGSGYFDVNTDGNVTVAPEGPQGPRVDLLKLVKEIEARRIRMPVLLRFNGILRHRIRTIYQAFQSAIREYSYTANYYPAYPIKVNQQRHIVDVIRQTGNEFTMALEVGSKPELIAVLGIHDNPDAFLLCNGYKDEEYIELALLSQKIGRQPIIIIEKFSELNLVLKVAARLGVQPKIGLRLKLTGKGAGRWERSGGDRAKFGLSIGEILQCFQQLKELGQLDALRLLHFHAGSQLTSIATLGSALKEAGQVFVQLRRECPQLEFLDVGGGLGVDYDGSKTNFESSMNYTLEEYARDVIWIVQDICQQGGVPAPHIITEAGRATVAHHALLVFDVLGIANTFGDPCNPDHVLEKTKHPTVRHLAQVLKELTPKNCQEALHDAVTMRSEMVQQFNLGLMSIHDRALGDQVYWATLVAVAKASKTLHYVPEDLERLPSMLTDTYFCNFSIFQSLPDSWAIEQIFPITPLHRLNEEPTVPVVLADITCDSDGEIDRFPDLKDIKRYLPAHKLQNGEPYYFVAFLVGAYQEILGDLHNLFGDTNAIHVEVPAEGRFEFSNVVHGDSVREVLHYVQFEKDDLCERWRTAVEAAVSRGTISGGESGEIFRKFVDAFENYTYLYSSNGPE